MGKGRYAPKPLGDVVEFYNGKSIKPGGEGQYPVYGSNGIIGGSDEYKYDDGIIIGRVGAYCGSIAYCPGRFWASDNTIVAKPKDGRHDVKFLYYLLTDAKLNRHAGGAAQPLVTQTTLRQVKLPVPDLPVQRKIAGVLAAYDELIENNTRRIKLLEQMAQALYREWFVRPGQSGKLPKGWETKKVTDAVYVNPPTPVAKEAEKPYVPMDSLSTTSMLIGQFQMRTGNSGSKYRNGDTLFARITPCLENGKTAFVQFLPSDNDVAIGSTEFIVLRSKTLCPEYVYLMARSDAFRDNAIKSMSGASGRQRVQEKCFEKFTIALPDAGPLAKFVDCVRPMFRLVHSLAQKNANLRRTRDLLLPKLIAGEVDVSALEIETGERTP